MLKIKDNWHWSFFSIIFILLVTRIFFAVDFSDEAQYVSQGIIPYLGGSFFITDLFLQQIPGILFYPITYIYLNLFGTEGIFLFYRLLFIALLLFSSYSFYQLIKDYFDKQESTLILTGLLSYIPFSIPSLSYNTITYSLFPLVALLIVKKNKKTSQSFLLAYSLTIIGLSYPPLGILLGLYILIFFQRNRVSILGSAALILSLIILFLCTSDFSTLQESLKFTSSFTDTTFKAKISYLWFQSGKVVLSSIPVWIIWTLRRYNRKLKSIPLGWITALIGISFYFGLKFFYPLYHNGHNLIFILGIILIPSFLISNKNKDLQLFGIVSILGGILCSYSSSNGIYNFSLVALPIVLISLLKNTILFNKYLLLTISISTLCVSNYLFVYRDSGFMELNTQISEGPYKGLFTTAENKNLIYFIQNSLKECASEGQTILAIGAPWVYTITNRKPMTKMLYIHESPIKKMALDLALSPISSNKLPDVFVLNKKAHINTHNYIKQKININRDYDLINSSYNFDIYSLKRGNR